jgi:hypothetical protein
MNITIKVEAPEIVEAIDRLSQSILMATTPRIVHDEPAPKAKRVKAEAPAPAPAPTPEAEAPAPAPAAPVTLVQVRARLAELSSEGKKEAIKKLMADFGVSKLTEVPEEKYGELMSAAEAL